ncbi:MAG: LLM class flavin-dependent oxidoreductase [Myxococcota bacterium]|nr:LLM class flavin-dependent oxidoreductase [Myxococcota bacterium]MDP7074372.1 LLM class flavin-dependent oxidoreductase [Myxococcota bacterium]MDP7300527.1 LLM class flavin-dependent oxidoreductase [Myxococcota bacterium]MDP7434125.1 LLM class flavin-dependent oxidoreductase [Myxococcota bacterium]MDP7570904.1 LLM class flavin-dependent oxidoreductase [Myxococcota bacterium]
MPAGEKASYCHAPLKQPFPRIARSDKIALLHPRCHDPAGAAPDQHMPSQIVMLSAIAAVTKTIRLNAAATLAPLRHPLLNAKQWATLDLVSGGRVTILPIGSWQAEEYEAFGIPHEERGRRLDEQLEIMRLVWKETPASYRVIQRSTGNVGAFALRAILGHPELEFVGVWVRSEDEDGVRITQ